MSLIPQKELAGAAELSDFLGFLECLGGEPAQQIVGN